MIFNVNGNACRVYIPANEVAEGRVNIDLPDGYSYKTILITYSKNVIEINTAVTIVVGADYTFPIVNSSSPCTISLYIPTPNAVAELRFIIEEFGQKPNPKYFEKAFDPILVTGSDGKDYNVIPSDQFK
jgi:hypothetical protein|nr:MAG TPA_asm: hypothetical protein [Caudoviricetes sp.]